MKKSLFATVMVGALALFSMLPARAQQVSSENQVLFGITFIQNQLITIDTKTGEGTLVGDIGENVNGFGLAAYQGKLYTFNPNDQTIDQLSVVNGHVVTATNIGVTGIQGEGDLAIRSDTGVGFLAAAFDASGNPTHPFYTFDVTAGTAAQLGNSSVTLDGLAFDSSQTLYAIGQGDVNGGDPAQGDATLYTVNQLNGSLTTVGTLGVPQNSPVAGITFAPDGTLYAAIDDRLYTINKSTGVATIVDGDTPDFSFSSVSGLAYANGASVLGNISSRADVGTGEDVLIGGFILRATSSTTANPAPSPAPTTKQIILRALGPSLKQQGINGTLDDPTLTLYDDTGTAIATNDNWQQNSQADRTTINNDGLAPLDPRESVIVANLPVGKYTAIVRGVNGTTGIALQEVYDTDIGNGIDQRNLSARANVQTGANVLIAGIIVRGSASQDTVIRGLGPSLMGISKPLPDPVLDLYDANGNQLATNDDYQQSPQATKIAADGLSPSNPKESAIDMTLADGNYTAILHGKDSSDVGVGQIEVYMP